MTRRRACAWLIPLLLAALAGWPALADMGPLGPPLLALEGSAFSATAGADGAVILTNRSDPGALKEMLLSPARDEGRRRLAVTVEIAEPDVPARAGLLLAGQADPVAFFVYALEQTAEDAALVLYFVDPSRGFEQLWRAPVTDGAGTHMLGAVESGQQLTLTHQGVPVLTAEQERFGSGQVGVVVWGRGVFTLSQWSRLVR